MAPKKQQKKRVSEYHGILLIDKPLGITSHDVVNLIRKIYDTRRVGHTGTLDPQATGLLVILLGEATKISELLVNCDKSYEGAFKLGVVSNTYDSEGEVVDGPGGPLPKTLDEVQDIANGFSGHIKQVPPPYSAKKVKGKRLYEYARKGKTVEVEPRDIHVPDYEIIEYNPEDGTGEFGVDCSSGTYIRSLVHDLGQQLGCGALLTELNRTDVGEFRLEDAWHLDDLQKLKGHPAKLRASLHNVTKGLTDYPTFYLMQDGERWLRNGQAIPHNLVHNDDDIRPVRNSRVVLVRMNGDAVAIARVDPAPVSPPPRALVNPTPPWYQPVKLFEIPIVDDDDDEIEEDGNFEEEEDTE